MKSLNSATDRAHAALKAHILSPSDLSAVSAHFSVHAFRRLLEEIPSIQSLRLLFSAPQSLRGELFLSGGADERPFRNALTQPEDAEFCRAWLSAHAELRQARGENSVASLLATDGYMLWGNNLGLTASGLGFTNDPEALEGVMESADPSEIESLRKNFFESNWDNSQRVSDCKAAFVECLTWLSRRKSPAFFYRDMLYRLFSEELDRLDEKRITDQAAGIQETLVWKKLYRFQKDGVLGILDKLEQYNGCILADSVGLGKTFEALAVIKYYELRGNNVLVLCPKRLRENWTLYTSNYEQNPFAEDRFGYTVLNHTDLGRDEGMSGDIDLSRFRWQNFQLVVIDESHNFRNAPSEAKTPGSRYGRLLEKVIQSGCKTRVLMLSATPVNNRMNDLKSQVKLITADRDYALAPFGIPSYAETLKRAQAAFRHWMDSGNRSAKTLVEALNYEYFQLLDLLTIARSRKHIEKYYSAEEVGGFPERRPPKNFYPGIDREEGEGAFPVLGAVNDKIAGLRLARYAPFDYLLPSKRAEYIERYRTQLDGKRLFEQTDREKNLIHLMRVNLLKRLESSVYAFRETVQRQLDEVVALRKKIASFQKHAGVGTFPVSFRGDDGVFAEEDEETAPPEAQVGSNVVVDLADCDLAAWDTDLHRDQEDLEFLRRCAGVVTPERDAKLSALRGFLDEKFGTCPCNSGNRKVLVFTASADTARYLYGQLADWALREHGVHSALICGDGKNSHTLGGCSRRDQGTILEAFAPIAKERPAARAADGTLDLLVATDCISEGQNLQDCDCVVNYDIHWNPVRIIQRFGRVDRLKSPNKTIQLVNFWPTLDLDEYINLESRVEGRMKMLSISATGDEDLMETEPKPAELAYRRAQLESLRERVPALEELAGGVALTDLTLASFRSDLSKALSDPAMCACFEATPYGLVAVSRLDEESRREGLRAGAFFFLKDTKTPAEEPARPLSALPSKLLFVSDDGEVLLSCERTRSILEALRRVCLVRPVVEESLWLAMPERGHYRRLLSRAVAALAGAEERRGLQTLFQPGGVRLSEDDPECRPNDFEVVGMLAVLPPEEDADGGTARGEKR